MEQSFESSNQSNGRQLLLKLYTERDTFKEGTNDWTKVQNRINVIIAQNYLEYINR